MYVYETYFIMVDAAPIIVSCGWTEANPKAEFHIIKVSLLFVLFQKIILLSLNLKNNCKSKLFLNHFSGIRRLVLKAVDYKSMSSEIMLNKIRSYVCCIEKSVSNA